LLSCVTQTLPDSFSTSSVIWSGLYYSPAASISGTAPFIGFRMINTQLSFSASFGLYNYTSSSQLPDTLMSSIVSGSTNSSAQVTDFLLPSPIQIPMNSAFYVAISLPSSITITQNLYQPAYSQINSLPAYQCTTPTNIPNSFNISNCAGGSNILTDATIFPILLLFCVNSSSTTSVQGTSTSSVASSSTSSVASSSTSSIASSSTSSVASSSTSSIASSSTSSIASSSTSSIASSSTSSVALSSTSSVGPSPKSISKLNAAIEFALIILFLWI